MSKTVLKVENLSKQYRLGEVGTGTLSHDLNRWWSKLRGKDDPYLKIGETNDQTKKGGSDYVWALKDINFEVKQGEVLGIIGKNGAGKSTLLKILSKVTGPTTGTIKAKGRVASLLEVGTGFHPEMTGRENVYMNGTIMGMSRHEITKKLDEIVDFAGVAKYLDTPVKRYSSGMTVRLGFAVAAHLESEILIVDEVLAVGDAEFQKKAIGKMQDVSKGEGRTVLFVSHNMGSVRKLCTSCVLLENGKIKNKGNTDYIVNSYLAKGIDGKIIPINERIDFVGTGNIKVEKLEFYSNNNLVELVQSGQYFEIILEFIAHKELEDCNLKIKAVDRLGNSIFILNNRLSSQNKLTIKKGLNCYKCKIKRLPLNIGIYLLNLTIRSQKQIQFHLESIKNLEIIQGNYFLTGKLPERKTKILISHEWFDREDKI